MFLKSHNPCPDPQCPYCALHCPYCGTTEIVLDPERGRIGCPACGVSEDMPAPEYIAARHREVLVLTGQTIAAWKARARQLSAPFHHRWATAMRYLNPVATAALARCDHLMIQGATCEEAMRQARADLPALQQCFEEHPELNTTGLLTGNAILDDWF